jgi:hypothetical protein
MFPGSPPLTANLELIEQFRQRNHQSVGLGFLAGFPTFFFKGFQDHIGETVLIKQGGVQPHDITFDELNKALDDPRPVGTFDVGLDDFRERFRAVNAFAMKNGFMGGFPTFEPATTLFHEVNGAIFFPALISAPNCVALSELRELNGRASLDDPREEFKGAHVFARNQQGIVAGFPTFMRGDKSGDGTLFPRPLGQGDFTNVIVLSEFAAEIRELSVFTPIP